MKLKKYSCNIEQEEFGPGDLGYPVTLLLAIKSFIGMIFHISNFIPYFSKNNSLNRERKNNLEEHYATPRTNILYCCQLGLLAAVECVSLDKFTQVVICL